MENAIEKKDIILSLDITDDRFVFSTSITDAITQAELELVAINETVDSLEKLKPKCDKLDYILAASSGALCGVIDLFLVGNPGESPIGKLTDKWFADRTLDFAKLCHPKHKSFDKLNSAIRYLGEIFKVPYDQTGLGDAGRSIFGLDAKNHHFKSLAHNPSLLGLFFSILDQFMNVSHFVSDGQLVFLNQASKTWVLQGGNIPAKLFCGFVNWIGHLVSDISGSPDSVKKGNRGMGIPSPLWTWVNDIIALKAKLGLNVTEVDKAFYNLALEIFKKGYDTRFQAAQAIPVFLNELLVRFIYAIRRLFKYYTELPKEEHSFKLLWKQCEPFSNPTIKRMLTVAHGTFCLVDVGDAVGRAFVSGGGSFNVVEFVLRLNIIGVGRFAISLYGETKSAISYRHAKQRADFASKERCIVQDYLEGLKILSKRYDDAYLLELIVGLQKSEVYNDVNIIGNAKNAFIASAKLAELRNVSENKSLKSKQEIDKYFNNLS